MTINNNRIAKSNIAQTALKAVGFCATAGLIAVLFNIFYVEYKEGLRKVRKEDVKILISPPLEINGKVKQRIYLINKSVNPIDDVRIGIKIPDIRNCNYEYNISEDLLLQKSDQSISDNWFYIVMQRMIKSNLYYIDMSWNGSKLQSTDIKFDSKVLHECDTKLLESKDFN